AGRVPELPGDHAGRMPHRILVAAGIPEIAVPAEAVDRLPTYAAEARSERKGLLAVGRGGCTERRRQAAFAVLAEPPGPSRRRAPGGGAAGGAQGGGGPGGAGGVWAKKGAARGPGRGGDDRGVGGGGEPGCGKPRGRPFVRARRPLPVRRLDHLPPVRHASLA